MKPSGGLDDGSCCCSGGHGPARWGSYSFTVIDGKRFFSVLRSVAPAFFDPIGDPLWIFSSVSFACFLLSLCYCLHCIPGFYGSPRDKRKLITVTTMAAMSGTYNPGSV